MKKLFKWLAYLAAAFIVAVSVVAGVSQTQFFRDKLRSLVLDELDSLLIAEVRLGEIHGNLVTGFSIDSVSIKVDNEYLVRADRINIRYDLFQLPSKKINVSSLTLVRPQIALLCGRDSVWNFGRMIRPIPDDSTSTPFNWPIAVDRFEINEGRLLLTDSARLAEYDHVSSSSYFVEYHDFVVREVNMVITSVLIAPEEKRAKIMSLSLVLEEPDVHVNNFSGEFSVTKNETAVKNMLLETAHSALRLDASLRDVDLFGGVDLAELKTKPVNLSLRANDLDLNELDRFIEQLNFLDGRLALELSVEGEFGAVNVNNCDLKIWDSELHIAGRVSNLNHPSDLMLNVQCRKGVVNYGDLRALMPMNGLPDYTGLGVGHIEFDFDGRPLDFTTNLELVTDAGEVATRGARIMIGGPEAMRYSAEFDVRNLNLAPLLHDESFKSRLNGTVHAKGAGLSLDNLNATAHVQVDSSEFAGNHIGSSRVSFTALNQLYNGVLNLAVGSMHAQLNADLDRTNIAMPVFKIDGMVSSLNLADLLHDESHKSDLTLAINAQGSGLAWEKLNCAATLDFSSSRYKEYQIDSGFVNLSIDQRDPLHSNISIKSNLADFAISGQFDLDYMGRLIRYEIDNLNLAIGQRFSSLDSTLATSLDVKELAASGKRLAAANKQLDAKYELRFKNLEPLSILAGDRTFDAVGAVTGSLKGNYFDLAGDAQLALNEFFYGNADSGMLIENGSATLKFSTLKPDNPLSELTLRISADAGKMHLNRTKLDTLNFGIFYDKEYAGFVLQADYDQDIHLRTNGQVSVTDDGVQFTLSTLFAAYQDFAWGADDGAVIAFNKNSMRVHDLTMRRDTQSVALNGALLSGDTLDASIAGRNIDLDNLKYFLRKEERGRDERTFEGAANLDVKARGTMDAPLYQAAVRADRVFFRGFAFGILQGDLDYKEELLSATLLIDNRATSKAEKPDLTIEGTLPINLALRGVDQRLSESEQMHFIVSSDGLQMSLLDPLVPTFNDLSGTLKSNLIVKGTPRHPEYAGTMSIEQCSFLFDPNNINYRNLNAQLQAEGERIKIVNATVQNVEADNRPGNQGQLTIAGDFLFRDLIPSDFNCWIQGELVVVNARTRSSSLSVYGNLPVEIPSPGLHFTGSVQNSLLKGRVVVRNSSFVLPPTTPGSEDEEVSFSLPLSFVNDTLKAVQDTTVPPTSRYFVTAVTGSQINSVTREKPSVSFVDGLHYDLEVECVGGNNEIRMIFNAATSEELMAKVYGKITITEDGKTWFGTLDVSRASYNFYGKRFSAEGTITYSGDFLNPELHITATYSGSRETATKIERVTVRYKITGSRMAPESDISMRIDDIDYAAYSGLKSGDVQSDALTFVVTGKFPLSKGEGNDLAAGLEQTVTSSLVGGATSLLTSTFSEFLRNKTGFISSIEVGFETGGTDTKKFGQRADIRLSGTAFKGYWRFGGKILDDPFSNANFSILYSFGDIFERPLLRNFMFELERKVDTSTLTEARKEVNSARFFYRFSF